MKLTKKQKAKLEQARKLATEVQDDLQWNEPMIARNSRMRMKLQCVERAVIFLENALLL